MLRRTKSSRTQRVRSSSPGPPEPASPRCSANGSRGSWRAARIRSASRSIVGSRRARQAARDALITRLPESLSSLHVLTFHGLGHLILRERFAALGYAEPPEVLSAADQFALVQDLLQGQDPSEWPAYGHLLTLRGFADQIRQFLLRAQEARITPEEIQAKAASRGLSGWLELARFSRAYLDVLDADRRRGLRGADRSRGSSGRRVRAAPRPSARRRLPRRHVRAGGARAVAPTERPRRRRGPGGARLLVPGDDRRPVAPVHAGVRRSVARGADHAPSRPTGGARRCVDRRTHLGGVRGRRTGAPAAPRR